MELLLVSWWYKLCLCWIGQWLYHGIWSERHKLSCPRTGPSEVEVWQKDLSFLSTNIHQVKHSFFSKSHKNYNSLSCIMWISWSKIDIYHKCEKSHIRLHGVYTWLKQVPSTCALFKAHKGQKWTRWCSINRRAEFVLELGLIFNFERTNHKEVWNSDAPSFCNADLYSSNVCCLLLL